MLLITGATGHSGKYFIRSLIENKYEGKIRCVVRENSDLDLLNNSQLNLELVYGDLSNPDFVDEIMPGIDTVMHIYNIHYSVDIIKAAIKNNVKRAYLVHTTGVFSNYKEASQEYKLIEKEIKRIADTAIDITILRPTMIYGDMQDHNMSKFIKMLHSTPIFPLLGGGKALIQPVNAKDLGEAYHKALNNFEKTANKYYVLSGDKPRSLKEIFKIISKKLNKHTIFIPIPIKFGVVIALVLKLITNGKVDFVEKVLRMGEDRNFSHNEAFEDFNFTPQSFESGISKEIIEFKEKIKK